MEFITKYHCLLDEALKSLRVRESDLIKGRIGQVQNRLHSLATTLTELLADQMQDSVSQLTTSITGASPLYFSLCPDSAALCISEPFFLCL